MRQVTVTNGYHSVGRETSTCYRGTFLRVKRHYRPEETSSGRYLMRSADCDGKWFPDAESANRYLLEHGYTVPYFRSASLRARRKARARRNDAILRKAVRGIDLDTEDGRRTLADRVEESCSPSENAETFIPYLWGFSDEVESC